MRWIAGGLLVLLAAACQRSGGPAQQNAAADTASMDTINRDPMDGMSREQIQQSARPMTQEQAQQMGVIDTTIKMEDQAPRDPRVETAPPRTAPR